MTQDVPRIEFSDDHHTRATDSAEPPFDPKSITRPDRVLLKHYLIQCLFFPPIFPIVFPIYYFKYHTLTYRFDDEGIAMSWGLLFRREIYLTYRRIQDIHLTRGLIQRWLGIATVSVQTASGNSGAEMSIEGILNPERLRDFLYSRMRGAQDQTDELDLAPAPAGTDVTSDAESAIAVTDESEDELTVLLREIRDDIRTLRERLP